MGGRSLTFGLPRDRSALIGCRKISAATASSCSRLRLQPPPNFQRQRPHRHAKRTQLKRPAQHSIDRRHSLLRRIEYSTLWATRHRIQNELCYTPSALDAHSSQGMSDSVCSQAQGHANKILYRLLRPRYVHCTRMLLGCAVDLVMDSERARERLETGRGEQDIGLGHEGTVNETE